MEKKKETKNEQEERKIAEKGRGEKEKQVDS